MELRLNTIVFKMEEFFFSSTFLPSINPALLRNNMALLENTLALFGNKWHLSFVKRVLMEDRWKRKNPLPYSEIPINTSVLVNLMEVEEDL